MSDTMEEYLQVCKADVAPKLTCIGCNGIYRGPVRFCQNNHGICSVCLPLDKNECPIIGCEQIATITVDALSALAKDLKLPITCKFRQDGCDQENPKEELMVEHETECLYRKVPCIGVGCPPQLVKNFEAHIFSAHYDAFGRYRENPLKWFLIQFANTKKLGAQKMWIDSESSLRFRAILIHNDDVKQWRCYTMVFGGKKVANMFTAEMRLSSCNEDTSLIFNCGVKCLDDRKEQDAAKEFCINDDQFKIFNKGYIELGEHNRDASGKLMMPVTVKVEMKKLNRA